MPQDPISSWEQSRLSQQGESYGPRLTGQGGSSQLNSAIASLGDPNSSLTSAIYNRRRDLTLNHAAQRQALLMQAWQSAVAVASGRTQAVVQHIQDTSGTDAQFEQSRTTAQIAYLEATGQINVKDAEALRQNIAARGEAYLGFLTSRGAMLLQNLTEREGLSLEQFLEQMIYDLTRSRGLTPEEGNFRPGYSGERRFGTAVTEEEVQQLPGYEAIQQNYAQQRTEAERQTDLDRGLTQANLDADLARADQGIQSARDRTVAGVTQARDMGSASVNRIQSQAGHDTRRASEMGRLDQMELDSSYSNRLAEQRLNVEEELANLELQAAAQLAQDQAYQQGRGGSGGRDSYGHETGVPGLVTPEDPNRRVGGGWGYTELEIKPQGYFAHGGVTELANRAAARRRRSVRPRA